MGTKFRLTIVVAFIGMGSGVLTSCGEKEVNSPNADAEFNTIGVKDSFYDITEKTILVGKTVEWSWQGSIGHSVTGGTSANPDGSFDSGVKTMGSFSHRFDTEGTFRYFCKVHGAAMTGTIVVTVQPGDGYGDPY